MEFHSWKSSLVTAKEYAATQGVRGGFPSVEEFYDRLIIDMVDARNNEMVNLGQAERVWYANKQPYYNVWPGIIEPLMRIDRTKVPSTHLHLPTPSIAFRLPDEKDDSDKKLQIIMQGAPVKCVLVASGRTTADSKTGCDRIMTIFAQTGRVEAVDNGVPLYSMSFAYLGIRDDFTVQEAYDHITKTFNTRFTPEEHESAMRLVSMIVGVCLLSTEKEDELIVPDVLGADRAKYAETQDDKYVEKAHRRGKVGWDVGKHITVSPHWRIGHFMLLKAGVAHRQQSRLVWRRGTMVKRQLASQLPTGYEGMPDNTGASDNGLGDKEAGSPDSPGA